MVQKKPSKRGPPPVPQSPLSPLLINIFLSFPATGLNVAGATAGRPCAKNNNNIIISYIICSSENPPDVARAVHV